MSIAARHIAIILDGNGRWARKRGHARIFGHVRGAQRVRTLTRECARRGLEALTLYTFSTENWKRPDSEVKFLMRLLRRYIIREREDILGNNIRFRTVGFIGMLPPEVQAELQELTEISANNTGMVLSLALSYGSRQEIAESARVLAHAVAAGKLQPDDIDENSIAENLFTVGLPEPDLMIRTGGERRISNFLLWQLAYTELYFTDVPWPEFSIAHLDEALESFQARERRFGKTSEQVQVSPQ